MATLKRRGEPKKLFIVCTSGWEREREYCRWSRDDQFMSQLQHPRECLNCPEQDRLWILITCNGFTSEWLLSFLQSKKVFGQRLGCEVKWNYSLLVARADVKRYQLGMNCVFSLFVFKYKVQEYCLVFWPQYSTYSRSIITNVWVVWRDLYYALISNVWKYSCICCMYT